ncbi:MAG: hypothetical protein WAM53_00920 [Terrimicrobiaceae bacterium]
MKPKTILAVALVGALAFPTAVARAADLSAKVLASAEALAQADDPLVKHNYKQRRDTAL